MTAPVPGDATDIAGVSCEWDLFVDESGQFDSLEDDVACGGLLVSRSHVGINGSDLRKALEGAAPEFSWPLHAAHFNIPAFFAITAYVREQQNPSSAKSQLSARARAVELIGRLRESHDGLVAPLLPAATGRRPKSISALRQLDRQMRATDWPTYRKIEGYLDELRARIRRIIIALGKDATESTPGTALVFASSETWRGAASESRLPKKRATARYDAMLCALAARVQLVLENREGIHRVYAHVLQRDRYDDKIRRVRPTSVEDVSRLVVKATGRRRRVEVRAEDVPNYGEHVSAPLVLADYIANRARIELRRTEVRLAAVEAAFKETLGIQPRSGQPARSHLAVFPVIEEPELSTTSNVKLWVREWVAEGKEQ